MWIARDEWTQKGIQGEIFFNTATPAIFGVPKYANELMKLVQGWVIGIKFVLVSLVLKVSFSCHLLQNTTSIFRAVQI